MVVLKSWYLLRPSQEGVPVPLFPSKKWPCSLAPPKQNLDFLYSLFPKIACVPLFPLFLGLCSPIPLKKLPLCHCFPKRLGGPLCLGGGGGMMKFAGIFWGMPKFVGIFWGLKSGLRPSPCSRQKSELEYPPHAPWD